MSRLVVVSNRVAPIEEGEATAGGLAAGVLDALKQTGGLWFGWSGEVTDAGETKSERKVGAITLFTIDLSRQDYDQFYRGFANGTLWPALHYQIGLGRFEWPELAGYRRVNETFARALVPMIGADDLIWVHDYHLLCLAASLRDLGVTNRIGLFLHTPFPAPGVFKTIPCHAELIRAMCVYDLLGFQTGGQIRAAFADYVLRDAGGGRVGSDASAVWTLSVFGANDARRRLSDRRARGRGPRSGRDAAQSPPGHAHARQSDGGLLLTLTAWTTPRACDSVLRRSSAFWRIPGAARAGYLHADRAAVALRHRDLSTHPARTRSRGAAVSTVGLPRWIGYRCVTSTKLCPQCVDAALRRSARPAW